MLISYITLFPDMIAQYLSHSILHKKQQEQYWDYRLYNIRDYTQDKHKTVDDIPYGGGAGMVMRADICHYAIEDALQKANIILGANHRYSLIIPSPHGPLFESKTIQTWQDYEHLIFICGRYEGIDERLCAYWQAELISIGDYVVMGGELPALIMSEAFLRKQDNILGNNTSHCADSYEANLLEYPHYTRPAIWQDLSVPEVLLSGHHQKIEAWRHEQSQQLTQKHRPELWQQYLQKKQNTI